MEELEEGAGAGAREGTGVGVGVRDAAVRVDVVVESAAQEHEWCEDEPAVGDGKDAGADANEDGTEAAEAAAVRKALRAAGAFDSWECCQKSVPKRCSVEEKKTIHKRLWISC